MPVDPSVKKSSLKNQACFAKLTEEETTQLAELLKEVRYKPGETIVTEGDPVDSVFLILSGTADVIVMRIVDHIPHTQSVAKLTTGQSIGLNDTGFYSLSGRRTATVVALTDMNLLKLELASFHGFALAHSHVNEIMRMNAQAMSAYRTE
jgi:CRP-like cAMP-binding protein